MSQASYGMYSASVRHALPPHQPQPRLNSRMGSSINDAAAAAAEKGSGYAPASRRILPVADSSDDDDLPEPVQFSAETRALLEEALGSAASPLRPTPAAAVAAAAAAADYGSSSRSGSGTLQGRASRPVSVIGWRRPQYGHSGYSPGSEGSGSPPSRRVVRLSGNSTGTSTTAVPPRRPQPASRPHSPGGAGRSGFDDGGGAGGGGGGGGGSSSTHDLITPAARPRINSRSIMSVSRQGSYAENAQKDAAPPPSVQGTVGSVYTGGPNDSLLRSGYTAATRPKVGEESGVYSSLRIKRAGKVSGSFLSGPARRPQRRQSREESKPPLQEKVSPEADAAGQGYPGNDGPSYQQSLLPQTDSGPPLTNSQDSANPAREADAPHHYHHHHHVRFATRSPEMDDAGENHQPAHPSTNAKRLPESLHSSATELSKGSKGSVSSSGFSSQPPSQSQSQPPRPVFKVAPLPPLLPSMHDQENEPPPTFNRNKPSVAALPDGIQILSALAQDEKQQQKQQQQPVRSLSTAESPPPSRPALNARSHNTPRRPAPPPPPPKMTVLETVTATAGAATTSMTKKKRNHVSINGKVFLRVSCLGRGGSSRVYKVMAENDNFLALKRVQFEDADEVTVRGYKGEIDLLNRLKKVSRVVNLVDWEINEEKHTLSMLMECGETDFEKILKARLTAEAARFDICFARFYWKEMLECVQAVHEYSIVHTDLKPANFLLVKGHLKLIDFGIAGAIQDDTVNIYREHLVGTTNYMSPEAIIDTLVNTNKRGLNPATNDPNSNNNINNNDNEKNPHGANNGSAAAASASSSVAQHVMRIGKPSDVWSLGCILYQMVYGRPPFAHIANQMHRIAVIRDAAQHTIAFPAAGLGDVPLPPGLVRTLRRCLAHDPARRPTTAALLHEHDAFLYPDAERAGAVQLSEDVLARVLANVVGHCRAHGAPADAELAAWPAAFMERIKKAQREEE